MMSTFGVIPHITFVLVALVDVCVAHQTPFRCFTEDCIHNDVCMIRIFNSDTTGNCARMPHHAPGLQLCPQTLLQDPNQGNVDLNCFCDNEKCMLELTGLLLFRALTNVGGSTPSSHVLDCVGTRCSIGKICYIEDGGGSPIGRCMEDPTKLGTKVTFGCSSHTLPCYCKRDDCIATAKTIRPTTTTSATLVKSTTITTPVQHTVKTTENPLCVDNDNRCALYKDSLCHATAHTYVVATCAKTCNKCDEYIATLKTKTITTHRPLLNAQSTSSVTTSNPSTARQTKCHTCGNIDSLTPCSTDEVYRNLTSPCQTGQDFCMTDVLTDNFGKEHIFKGCVTEQTCHAKWTNNSAKLDYCTQYGMVNNHNVHECHFCCHDDGCNSNIKPSTLSLVKPKLASLFVGK